ncbi:hypothetical protein IFR04_003255 [Cadophora malorum]|uniref:Monocarboxylate transporter n=1 Tax=Cadophora malorum TaxID=108018 RepID=A0A8H7WF46_9HELO|nr:hypothetical protein IFR04_003255 [Cadophora malorum]
MINGDRSRDHPDNCTEFIVNADEDTILPPVDGGRQAWAFMIGAFMIEGLMWGFPLTFGVFQSYYQNNNTFTNNRYLSLVGTLTTAISYLGTPLIAFFTIKYPTYQKYMIWGGWLVCSLALVASSFATQVWHLIVAQGFLYGFGFLIIYYPLLNMLNGWFILRRGLAYGTLFGSAGICGLGLPFMIEKMLKQYGYATTLRAYGVAILVLVGPTLPLVRGRLIRQIDNGIENKINPAVFKKPMFFAPTHLPWVSHQSRGLCYSPF